MKGINKRECRKHADPKLKFNRNAGILRTEKIKYVVRTALKNIGGQRMLLLYVYPRERLAVGDFHPRWITFQSRNDYLTFSMREDGKAVWQTSIFENLEREWGLGCRCAFYSLHDEQRVTRFCRDCSHIGFSALYHLQWALKDQKELERRHMKQRKIIARMKGILPLPRDLKGWIHRELLPQYLFYKYHKGKAAMKGYCTACRHEVEVASPKHNQRGVCPRCKKEVTFKARGKLGYLSNRDTVQVLQKISGSELLIRILKVYCSYRKRDVPELDVYESTRIFVRWEGQRECISEPYHTSYDTGDLTPWKVGYCPVMYIYQTNFNAETCGHLYCRNLTETLAGTPWQYAQLGQFYLSDRRALEVLPFLEVSLKQPKLEMLIKLGFTMLASDLVYRLGYRDVLDETKKKPHEIFKVCAEDISFLREQNVSLAMLKSYQSYVMANLKDRNALFCWQTENNLSNKQILDLTRLITPHKLMRYVAEQFAMLKERRNDYKTKRYESMQRVLSEYSDYLRMCRNEGYNLQNSFVLFPRSLQEGHDRLSKRIKLKADIKQHQQFAEAYRQITAHLDFERKGLKIICPQRPEDIVAEGNALHHCVGGYVDRVAEKECIILFLRHADAPETSFFTIEVRGGVVAQVRGMHNCSPTPEVESFMDMWEKKVLRRRSLPDAA